MNIKNKKINELTPYENNPRFNDGAVDAVAASIEQFGFLVPIVVDENGVIASGHTRYKAAKQLGIKTVPCVVASDLTDEQVKAFRLADNKVGELADWDNDKLIVELDDIESLDMEDFGFSEADFADIDLDNEDGGEETSTDDEDGATVMTCPKCGFKFEVKQ